MNTESVTNSLRETGSSGRMRTGAALQPSVGFISGVVVVGVAVIWLGAFSSQAIVALAFFAALLIPAILIKINLRIIFLGLILGYFFGGNIFGKLGLTSAGLPLYMGEIGIGLGVTLLMATNILEHREWRAAFVPMRPVLLPFGIFLIMGVASVVVGAFGVVRAEITAVPIAISAIPWIGDIYLGYYSLKVGLRHFAFVYYALMFFVPTIIIRSWGEFRNTTYIMVGALLVVIPMRQLGLFGHLAHYYHPMGMIACMALFYRERSSLARVGLFVLILWAAYLTAIDDVRSNILALGAVGFVIAMYELRFNWRHLKINFTRKSFLICVVGALMIAALGWLLIPSTSFRELTSLFNQVDKFRILFSADMADYKGGSEGWRTAMWADMLKAAFRAPLTGIGLGTPFYPASFMQKGWLWNDFNDQSLTMFVYPHNSVLFVLLRMGLPATVALLVMLVRCWRMAFGLQFIARRRFAADAAYFLGAATLFMFCASLTSVMLELPQAAIPFWFLLGMIPVAVRFANGGRPSTYAAPVDAAQAATK